MLVLVLQKMKNAVKYKTMNQAFIEIVEQNRSKAINRLIKENVMSKNGL